MEKNTLIVVAERMLYAEAWAKKHIMPASVRPAFTSILDVWDFCRGTRGLTILFINVIPEPQFIVQHAHRNNIITIQDNS